MSIEVRDLVKEYDGQKAVNNISFKAAKGEIVGFLGPNGAGKSTTMKIITGYLRQSSGQAWVCGINVSEDPLAVKKKIGYLPELNALYYDMYVREYLCFVAELYKVTDRTRRVEEIIGLTGLLPESRKKIGQLSKGYKQRVGLAAALIHDPEVLILDEPTSGLDPNQIVEIRDVIRAQGKSKTVLFSSHILQEAEAMCDRVIIINKGQLVADDSLQNLRKAGTDQQQVVVQFRETVEEEVIRSMADVSEVTRLTRGEGSAFRLRTSNADSVRKQILELSFNRHFNIISLQSEEQSLESIFRELTGPRDPVSETGLPAEDL